MTTSLIPGEEPCRADPGDPTKNHEGKLDSVERLADEVTRLYSQLSANQQTAVTLKTLREELVRARAEADGLRRENCRLQRQLKALLESASWRVTAPLRTLYPWWTHFSVGHIRQLGWAGLSSLRRSARRFRRSGHLLLTRITDARWRQPEVQVIHQSGLFDRAYYLRTNPEVEADGLDPVLHYVLRGAQEGRDPHPLFDTSYYLNNNRAVGKGGANPLVHFLLVGGRAGRKPHPLFDTSYYLDQNSGAARSAQNPLLHYLSVGEKVGCDPSPYFDVDYYRSVHSHLLRASGETSPLIHFASEGWRLGLSPARTVAFSSYLLTCTEGLSAEETYYDFFEKVLEESSNTYLMPKGIVSGTATSSVGAVRQCGPLAPPVRLPPPDGVPGLTFFGPLTTASGLGQAARGYLTAFKEAGMLCSTIPTGVPPHQVSVPFQFDRYVRMDWPVAFAHVNPQGMEEFFREHGAQFAAAEYRIGGWVWELPALPTEWFLAAVPFDEIWVPSSFCRRAIQASTDVPVFRIPYVVTPRPSAAGREPQARTTMRRQFGIPEGAFTFLYVFDASSYVERKNPFALIRAFREEFAGREEVALVLKTSYSHYDPSFLPRFRAELAEATNVTISVIDKVLSEGELTDLLLAADCYVSPHRSEGFGLTLAEAMLEGKPVIGTAFGGVTDFLSDETAYPLKYDLFEIEQDLGPYMAGNVWAEPSVAHLRERMREVFRDPAAAAGRGARGRELITSAFSAKAVGTLIGERMHAIYGV
jgi:glycosyltransferase involved in cell wall biosynthesis